MTLDKAAAGKIALQSFLTKTKLASEETEKLFQKACSIDYWRALNPQLHVCENLDFSQFEISPFSAEENQKLSEKLAREGYFQTAPLVDKAVAGRMRAGIETLRAAGWHELCAFVYDEFWQVTRTPSLVEFLRGALGEKFKALPHAVVHYVHAETGAGWSPHVDFSDRENRFTVWFALNEATLENGCMHVIPKHRVSAELLEKWMKTETLDHRQACRLLQASRALPVEAGTILGWERDVIHWGGFSSGQVEPRISLSVVCLRENVEPHADEIPLLSPEKTPTFAQRLLTVGKAFDYYSIHVLALRKYRELSGRLVREFKERAVAESVSD